MKDFREIRDYSKSLRHETVVLCLLKFKYYLENNLMIIIIYWNKMFPSLLVYCK